MAFVFNFLMLSSPSVLLYLILSLFFKKNKPNHKYNYEIFTNADEKIALKRRLRISWFIGLIYVVLFYFSLPVLIWRYGLKKGTLLLFLPIFFGIVASSIIGDVGTIERFGVGIITSSILRTFVGMYIFLNDREILVKTLMSSGWVSIGHCKAKSRKAAVKVSCDVFGVEPS